MKTRISRIHNTGYNREPYNVLPAHKVPGSENKVIRLMIPGLNPRNVTIEWDERFMYLFSGLLKTGPWTGPSIMPSYKNFKIPLSKNSDISLLKVSHTGNSIEIILPPKNTISPRVKKAA